MSILAARDLAAAQPGECISEFERSFLRLALTSGDERLAVLQQTGRNRYNVPPHQALDGTWFASSTASPISSRGLAAACAALAAITGPRAGRRIGDWAADIRGRLQTLFGIAGSEVILAGSGTEAELIVLALAHTFLKRPSTNIVVAPTETGSGVAFAAAGRHFLGSASCEPKVERGTLLDGILPGAVSTDFVDIRSPSGVALDAESVDRAVVAKAEAAVGEGRDVIVHCLDTSKTGLAGLSRATASTLLQTLRGHCVVVVDACQLRCSADQIRSDLAAGFMVMITGSKFAGGPAFSGAVLVPPGLVGQVHGILPAGLRAYSAQHDWPSALRDRAGLQWSTAYNVGLYVRWEAALAELDRYVALAAPVKIAIAQRFAALVASALTGSEGLRLLDDAGTGSAAGSRTIFPVWTTWPDGRLVDAHQLYAALCGRGFHVGQPVTVGNRGVLRICLSAPLVVDVAIRMAAGEDLETASAWLGSRLDGLVSTWSSLRAKGIALPEV